MISLLSVGRINSNLISNRLLYSTARFYSQNNSTDKDNFIKIIEVGPRDGLQNEKSLIPTSIKLELIHRLASNDSNFGAGISVIEATSFVSPKWVPQMSDSIDIMKGINQFNFSNVKFPVLTPNLKGVENAIKFGAKEIAIFPAASETFSQKNLNCDISTSLENFNHVVKYAIEKNIPVRGYISTVLGCPYEGEIKPNKVVDIALRLIDMGCYEISLGDTIGIGTPGSTTLLLNSLKSAGIPFNILAMHCHDTYGQALANILRALDMGIRSIDSSIAGLGGCPYAKGATGNVATEDVVYCLNGLGLNTGINLSNLVKIGDWITKQLGKERNESRVGRALSVKWGL